MGAQTQNLAGGHGTATQLAAAAGPAGILAKGGFGMQFSCTCIYHPHPATARLVVHVHDPFCGVRAHRVAASTKFEPSYLFGR